MLCTSTDLQSPDRPHPSPGHDLTQCSLIQSQVMRMMLKNHAEVSKGATKKRSLTLSASIFSCLPACPESSSSNFSSRSAICGSAKRSDCVQKMVKDRRPRPRAESVDQPSSGKHRRVDASVPMQKREGIWPCIRDKFYLP